MAMSSSGLSAKIKSEMQALLGSAADDAKLQTFCDAIGKAVVDYLKSSAQVTGTCTTPAGPGTITGALS